MTRRFARLTISFMAVVALMVPALAGAATSAVWDQDFSTDTAGWFGSITVSGVGTALVEGDSAPYSLFDGYRDVWPGTWVAEIDVYLDPSWSTGEGFDYTVAATGSDGAHQRDYIFHVGVVDGYGLMVNGSNNTDFYANPYKLVNENDGEYFVVDTAGWYTLQHVFYDDGGALAVDLNLLDSGGATLWTATRTNAADTIPAEVGGNRYSWFTFVNGTIEIDNHQLFITVPDPDSKDDCKKDGWMDFGFENQGQCIRFVNTGKDSR